MSAGRRSQTRWMRRLTVINESRQTIEPAAAPDQQAGRRTLILLAFSATAGVTVEFYDFFLYGYAAASAFPAVFFPNLPPTEALVFSYLGVRRWFSRQAPGCFCLWPLRRSRGTQVRLHHQHLPRRPHHMPDRPSSGICNARDCRTDPAGGPAHPAGHRTRRRIRRRVGTARRIRLETKVARVLDVAGQPWHRARRHISQRGVAAVERQFRDAEAGVSRCCFRS